MNRQTFPGVFIDHHHQLDRTTVVGAVEHEVPRPDMVPMIRPKPDTGTVIQPQSATLRLFRGYLQPLTLPDTHHPPVADIPAL